MKECLLGKRDSRRYNKFISAATFKTFPNGYLVNQRLDYYFPVGKILKPSEILRRTNLFFSETMSHKKVHTETSAIKIIQSYRTLVRKKVGDEIQYRIKDDNPFKITIKKHKPNLEDAK